MVCYLLKTLDKSLTRTQINEILQRHGIANYFELAEAFADNANQSDDLTMLCLEYKGRQFQKTNNA